jgi:hypothetical protein
VAIAFRLRHSASPQGVHHKRPEYNSPFAPASAWSGGTLDKPWTCPGTIEPSQTRVFDQSYPDHFPAAFPRRNDSGPAQTADRDRPRHHGFPAHQVGAPFQAHQSARVAGISNTSLLGLICGAGSSRFGSNS